MSYTSTGTSNAPAWVAVDAGFFDRNGIDAELTYVESATTSLQALVSGSVDVVQGGGSQAVNGALSGADTVILAGLINVLPYKVMVAPAITQGADLRGKRIGISRFGSSSDFGARFMLKHFNLRPEDDTAIIQIGGQGARLAALKQGGIDAAVFEPPYNVVLAREGYRELVDTAELNLPYLHVSVFTSRAYLAQNERTLQQVMRAFVEAIAYMKREREATKQIIAKYTQEEDAEALEYAYDRFVASYLPRAPYAPLDSVRTLLEEIALTKPEATGQDPTRFVDDRFVRELDRSGFIASLYRS